MQNQLKTTLLNLNKTSRFFITPQGNQRVLVLLTLAGLLFLAGFYTENIFSGLTNFYNRFFLILGWNNLLSNSKAGVSSLVTMRSFPAIVTYGIGYTVLSFLFLHFYFKNLKQSQFTALFFLSIFFSCILLIICGKIFPQFPGAYKLARRLIEFVVSPFPIVLLIAAFKAFQAKK